MLFDQSPSRLHEDYRSRLPVVRDNTRPGKGHQVQDPVHDVPGITAHSILAPTQRIVETLPLLIAVASAPQNSKLRNPSHGSYRAVHLTVQHFDAVLPFQALQDRVAQRRPVSY